MMGTEILRVEILCGNHVHQTIVLQNISSAMTVAGLIVQVLPKLGLPTDLKGWKLLRQGVAISPDADLHSLLAAEKFHFPIRFELRSDSDESSDIKFQLQFTATNEFGATPLETGVADGDGFGDESIVDQGSSEFGSIPIIEAEPIGDKVKTENWERHKTSFLSRATIRYYKRMNTGRVYPFLVAITRDSIEKVKKKNTDQRSSSLFRFNALTAFEIEPIVPGCDCYPAKAMAVLRNDEWTGTFRVVPRIEGKVEGAVVHIRQDHQLLAEVKLEIVVVKRFWYLCFGAMTFVLPAISTVLKHFGIDFESQEGQGFNLYVRIASLIFDFLSPFALTIGLGIVTGIIWYFSRARTREVFWDIKKILPEERLLQIRALMTTSEVDAMKELDDLVRSFPNYRPAQLFLAETRYASKDFGGALTLFQSLMTTESLSANQYHAASNSAARLGDYQLALKILSKFESECDSKSVPGPALFNIGCYHARLGDTTNSLAYLRRAIDAGYKKLQAFAHDEDLDTLRSLPEFQNILSSSDLKIYVRCPSCESELWVEEHDTSNTILCPQCGKKMSIPKVA